MMMNLQRKLFLTGMVLAVAAVFGEGAKAKEEATPKKDEISEDAERLKLPVAKINSKPMTLGYLETATSRQSPFMRRELVLKEKRLEFLDRLIVMDLMAEEAARRGYDKHREVASVSKNQLASLMHRRIADNIQKADPSEESLRQYYDEHHDNYHKPEKVRARHILVSNKEKAEKLLEGVLKNKMSQHEFRRLAQENSEDEGNRLRGGDLTFFTKADERSEGDPEVEPEVVKAAFSLSKTGDIYPKLIKSSRGYHIVMRTGHRDKMDLSFEKAKDRLTTLVRRELRKKQIDDAISEIKNRSKLEIFEENLKYVVIDLSAGRPESDAKGGITKKGLAQRRKFLKNANPLKPQKKVVKPAP